MKERIHIGNVTEGGCRWVCSNSTDIDTSTAARPIRTNSGGPSHFGRHDRTAEIDALAFTDMNGRARRFDEALYDTYTDGVVVLDRGRIVYERYFGALEPQLPHACHSVTKSYAGTLAAALVHEGVLDDTIAQYLPELRGSAFEDATLRQVMDMHPYPVASEGAARIRMQVSAAHGAEDIERVITAF